jgi:hypothetical protein
MEIRRKYAVGIVLKPAKTWNYDTNGGVGFFIGFYTFKSMFKS